MSSKPRYVRQSCRWKRGCKKKTPRGSRLKPHTSLIHVAPSCHPLWKVLFRHRSVKWSLEVPDTWDPDAEPECNSETFPRWSSESFMVGSLLCPYQRGPYSKCFVQKDPFGPFQESAKSPRPSPRDPPHDRRWKKGDGSSVAERLSLCLRGHYVGLPGE